MLVRRFGVRVVRDERADSCSLARMQLMACTLIRDRTSTLCLCVHIRDLWMFSSKQNEAIRSACQSLRATQLHVFLMKMPSGASQKSRCFQKNVLDPIRFKVCIACLSSRVQLRLCTFHDPCSCKRFPDRRGTFAKVKKRPTRSSETKQPVPRQFWKRAEPRIVPEAKPAMLPQLCASLHPFTFCSSPPLVCFLLWQSDASLLDYMKDRDFPYILERPLFGRKLTSYSSVQRQSLVIKKVARQMFLGLKR